LVGRKPAEERGDTARAAVREGAKPGDFRRPGHMFPLEAVEREVAAVSPRFPMSEHPLLSNPGDARY